MVDRNQPNTRRRGIVVTVVAVLAFVALVLAAFVYTKTRQPVMSDSELKANGAYLFERPRDVGALSLVDDRGESFTEADLTGQWSLLFFGFTYCPDVCPTTLAQLSEFYRQLGPELAEDTRVMLVSVDPARDTPAKLHDYVGYFNPNFGGLTGEFLELHQFATALNIPFVKAPGGGENYLVEHSANVALLNDRGHYVGFFRAPIEADRLLRTYRSIRASY